MPFTDHELGELARDIATELGIAGAQIAVLTGGQISLVYDSERVLEYGFFGNQWRPVPAG